MGSTCVDFSSPPRGGLTDRGGGGRQQPTASIDSTLSKLVHDLVLSAMKMCIWAYNHYGLQLSLRPPGCTNPYHFRTYYRYISNCKNTSTRTSAGFILRSIKSTATSGKGNWYVQRYQSWRQYLQYPIFSKTNRVQIHC